MLMGLYGAAGCLLLYILYDLLLRGPKVSGVEESGSLDSLPSVMALPQSSGLDLAPKVLEKRVEVKSMEKLERERKSKHVSAVNQEVLPCDSVKKAWYDEKICRPLPESHRRANRGSEQFYLRDVDPTFR
jgi:hypothetical protein